MRMSSMTTRIALPAMMWGAMACRPMNDPLCAGTGTRGVDLRVVSETGENLQTVSTVTVVPLSPPADSARGPLLPGQYPLSIAERAGTYRLRVEAPGYQAWVTTVTVRADVDGCAPKVEIVNAVLKR